MRARVPDASPVAFQANCAVSLGNGLMELLVMVKVCQNLHHLPHQLGGGLLRSAPTRSQPGTIRTVLSHCIAPRFASRGCKLALQIEYWTKSISMLRVFSRSPPLTGMSSLSCGADASPLWLQMHMQACNFTRSTWSFLMPLIHQPAGLQCSDRFDEPAFTTTEPGSA